MRTRLVSDIDCRAAVEGDDERMSRVIGPPCQFDAAYVSPVTMPNCRRPDLRPDSTWEKDTKVFRQPHRPPLCRPSHCRSFLADDCAISTVPIHTPLDVPDSSP